MLFALAFSVLAVAAFLAAEAATLPSRQRRLSVRRASTYGRVQLKGHGTQLPFNQRVVEPTKQRLAGWALRLTPKASMESVAAKLRAAGLGRTVSPTTFLAAKVIASGCGLLVGAFLGSSSSPTTALLFGLMFAGALFVLPDTALTFRARSRKEQIRADLPDCLDLLAVSVEAGMGFDGAIQKLTEHLEGPLVDEFSLALGEMRVGESRADALRHLVDRVDVNEMAAFVRAIIQADQLGISLGRILRVQAADARHRRQAAAEEKAMKAPIKMLFPTALFIFPAMFVVILGPAMLSLLEIFN
ncbi:MAG: type II secretion system F family protein [Pseudomonadota bacterium]